jgi:hypothetical protein
MKTIRRSASLKFCALSLLATVSLTGNPVTATERGSDVQRQARELLSGMRQASELLSGSSRNLAARIGPVAGRAATPTDGRTDAQSQARAVLAPDLQGLRHSVSSDSAVTTAVNTGPGAERLARTQPDAQEAAKRLLGTATPR